jgi:hypothetical protein
VQGFYEHYDKTPNSLQSLHNCAHISAKGNAARGVTFVGQV